MTKRALDTQWKWLNKVLVMSTITKTCLYNFDPLKPHFYIVKMGFTGVYIIFLILLENFLEPPRPGSSNEYPQSVLSRNIKQKSDYLKIFLFWL